MTVGELKKALDNYPDDMAVKVYSDWHGEYVPAKWVERYNKDNYSWAGEEDYIRLTDYDAPAR